MGLSFCLTALLITASIVRQSPLECEMPGIHAVKYRITPELAAITYTSSTESFFVWSPHALFTDEVIGTSYHAIPDAALRS